MDTLAIIKRIELRLAELGMSKAEFYEKSGISSASYSQWNTGRYNPSRAKLQKAAVVLGLNLDYLCYGCEEKMPTVSGERDILDEVDIAFYNGFKELTEEQQETIRDMVQLMRARKASQEK